MKDTIMRKRGIGFLVAGGNGIKNHGEKKIIGHTEDGEGESLRIQRADVKQVLGSVHKMNMGRNAVALIGGRSYTQNKETNNKRRVNYEQRQCVMCVLVPVKEGEVAETEQASKGSRFLISAPESEDQQVVTRRV